MVCTRFSLFTARFITVILSFVAGRVLAMQSDAMGMAHASLAYLGSRSLGIGVWANGSGLTNGPHCFSLGFAQSEGAHTHWRLTNR